MTDTTTNDPLELVLLLELESIDAEIAVTLEQLRAVEQAQAEAEVRAGELRAAYDQLGADATPLILATGTEHLEQQAESHVVQAGVLVGDAEWAIRHPAAARAWGAVELAGKQRQIAEIKLSELSSLHEHLEYSVLHRLQSARDAKSQELDALRQAQAAAREHVADRGWVSEFRRRIRGEV